MSRKMLIAGNWKMNGLGADGGELAKAVAVGSSAVGCDLLICPPATLIYVAGEALSGSRVALGAQDCHAAESGAHTGDVSAEMLADAGCSFVIVGHSERRGAYAESDKIIYAKAQGVPRARLIAVI